MPPSKDSLRGLSVELNSKMTPSQVCGHSVAQTSCTLETRSATTPGVAMQCAAVPIASRRAVLRFPTLARLASRLLVLDLADQVCTHVREGMFDVGLVGGGHEVRPSR